jgi:hypothetical protein
VRYQLSRVRYQPSRVRNQPSRVRNQPSRVRNQRRQAREGAPRGGVGPNRLCRLGEEGACPPRAAPQAPRLTGPAGAALLEGAAYEGGEGRWVDGLHHEGVGAD